MNTFQKLCTLLVALPALGLSGCASMNSVVRSGQDLGQNVSSKFKGHAFVVGTVKAAPHADNMDTTSFLGGGHALSVEDQAKILKYEMHKYFKKANLAHGIQPAYRVNVAITAINNKDSVLQLGHVGYVRARVTVTTKTGRSVAPSFIVRANGPEASFDGSSCLALAERFNVPAMAVNLSSGMLALQQGKVNTFSAAMTDPYADMRSFIALDSPQLNTGHGDLWATEQSWRAHPIAYTTIEKVIGKQLAAFGCPVKAINSDCRGCNIFPENKKGLSKVYGLQ